LCECHQYVICSKFGPVISVHVVVVQLESGYGSESGLRRHGSKLSLTSTASVSTISTSSFKVSGIVIKLYHVKYSLFSMI